MKSLRKSLQRDSSHNSSFGSISGPLPNSVSKPAQAVIPPNKVIRASADHRSTAATELSFKKGDFFYVVKEVNGGVTPYYEAHNPLTGARGLVPRTLFEELVKGNNNQRTFSTISRASPIIASTSPPLKARPKVYYATVLHDFEAERSDELDARSGDMVSVVAQSNREWFVAKPIGKLGRPGLIPASFVEVKDPATQQIISMDTIVESGNLPSVEDWKREMLDYKASSIALGVLDDNVAPVTRSMAPASPPMPAMPPIFQQQTSPPPPMVQPAPPPPPPVRQPSPEPEPEPEVYQDYSNPDGESDPVYAQPQDPALLPEGILVSANVVSFHYEMEEYWFRVHALFQPYSASGSNVLPPARQLVLFRAYNDFYDFQVELLQVFPREGGRDPTYPRVLPYMPGPADKVNHEITASRQVELDDYLAKMADLRRSDARYVLEDALVRAFLAPKPGDVETEVEPVPEEVYSYQDEDNDMQEMANEMANMGVGSAQAQSYDDYGQDEEIIRPSQPSQQNPYQQRGYEDSTLRPTSNGRNPSPLPPHMRSSGYEQQNGNGYTNGNGNSSRVRSGYEANDRNSGYSRASAADPIPPMSAGSNRSSGHGRSRAQSALQSPPISANNPSPAFVKIKVFDAATDDLIAVRVHPRVTHAQLAEKISVRLGVQVTSLKYRVPNRLETLEDDEALHEWIDTTDKLVLYAD